MPTQHKKVKSQTTTELLSYTAVCPNGRWGTVTKEVPLTVAQAARLLAHRGECGVHLSEIGGSINGGRGLLAELELLGFLIKVKAMPHRGTGNAEVWVVGLFKLIDPAESVAA